MFWKKKKEEKKMFEVPEGNRGSYRVYPSDDEPILVKIQGGKTSKAIDICAGGISFPNDNYDKGIDPEKLTATGYADTFPMVPNNTKEGRAKNARIEFVLEKIPDKKAKKKKVDGREQMKPKKA